jgi:hypothetical protein
VQRFLKPIGVVVFHLGRRRRGIVGPIGRVVQRHREFGRLVRRIGCRVLDEGRKIGRQGGFGGIRVDGR